MPESGEVRLTTEYLDKQLRGKIVTDWVFCSGKHTDEFPPGYEEFISKLPLRMEYVSCKGKFIYFQFERDVAILHSMMMIRARERPTRDKLPTMSRARYLYQRPS